MGSRVSKQYDGHIRPLSDQQTYRMCSSQVGLVHLLHTGGLNALLIHPHLYGCYYETSWFGFMVHHIVFYLLYVPRKDIWPYGQKKNWSFKPLTLWNVCEPETVSEDLIPSHTLAFLPCCFFPFCSFVSPLTSQRTISSQKHNFFPMYGLCDVITGNIRQLCCINLRQWSYRKCDCLHAFIWRETDCP